MIEPGYNGRAHFFNCLLKLLLMCLKIPNS